MKWTKSTDDLYDYYHEIPDNERYAFLIELITDNPEIDVDFIELLEGTQEYKNLNIDSLLEFADTYRRVSEERYSYDYQFIENHIADWAFYSSNEELIDRCLDLVKGNPVEAIDSITVRILFQLIFHGYYQKAVEYSQSVLKPIAESEDLFGNPENYFITAIYLDGLEKQYELLKNGVTSQWDAFAKGLGKLGVDNNKDIMGLVKRALTTELSTQSIDAMLKTNPDDALATLDVHFLRYMKSKYGLPFIHSEFFFNIINTERVFGTNKELGAYFYIDYPLFKKHVYSQLGMFLGTVDPDDYGKVMGINYFYEFIHSIGLISDHYYELMLQNIAYLQWRMTLISNEQVWALSFVLGWPEGSSQLFKLSKDLFNRNKITRMDGYTEVKRWIESHIARPSGADRVEADINEEVRAEGGVPAQNIVSYGLSPYIKQSPEAGRNDPCPCGSGKKYKKCCLKS